MGYNWVQFRAMIRKDWLTMKAEKSKIFWELIFSVAYGMLIGYELSLQIKDPNLMGLGYCILLLTCPIVFQQSTNYIANAMVKDRDTKMKESLKIVGMQPWIYSLAFLVQRGIWMLLPTICVSAAILLFTSDYYDFRDIGPLFVALWLLGMGMCSVTMFLQNFFKNSKLAPMVLPFLFFIPTGVAMTILLGPILTGSVNTYIQYLYWFPTFPFTVILVDLLDTNDGVYFETSSGVAWVMLVL